MKSFFDRYVGAFCAVMLLLCVATVIRAAPVSVTWTNPTRNTDGTNIPSSGEGSLNGVRVEYGSCNGTAFGTKAGEITPTWPATTTTVDLKPGTHCFRVYVRNTYGSWSSSSNIMAKTVEAPTPEPAILVTVGVRVYDVIFDDSKWPIVATRGREVGKLLKGSPCDSNKTTGDDYYAVVNPKRAELYANASPRSSVLVAKCG